MQMQWEARTSTMINDFRAPVNVEGASNEAIMFAWQTIAEFIQVVFIFNS
jgi:hypothetical protein